MRDNEEQGTSVRLVDKRLYIVIMRWKDLKILSTVSTKINKGVTMISRRVASEIVKVKGPNSDSEYQKYMGGVDGGGLVM